MNERLGIPLPELNEPWENLSLQEQSSLLEMWEQIRGRIPDRIKAIEQIIIHKQNELFHEENFEQSCKLNSDIAEYASIINDLHIWYRTQQDIDAKFHH
ncbi:hypothetical protein [Paenibacillus marinisediminis]